MLANNKRLKKQMIDLHLPWWLKLVKSGIPYAIAATASIFVVLTLGGWLAMPESIQLLKWVEALFMAMSPAVKFLAVASIGLGTFLSTFEIFSVFVKGFLYHYAEKAASEGLEVAEQLAEQNKELRDNLALQMKLNEQFKNQAELLKGYAKGLHVGLDKKVVEQFNEQEPLEPNPQQTDLPQTGELDLDQDEAEAEEEANAEEQQEVDQQHEADDVQPKQPEPVIFSSQGQESKPKRKRDMSFRHHTMALSPRDQRRLLAHRPGHSVGSSSFSKKHHRKKLIPNGL